MKHAEKWLALAEELAKSGPRRPKRVNLRRAVSTAYYALFHLLTYEAAKALVGSHEIAIRLVRSYEHKDLKQVSEMFSRGKCPGAIGNLAVPAELKAVAGTPVEIQQARHTSDYDLVHEWRRLEVLELVDKVRKAFGAWERIRRDPVSRVYLACFLNRERWKDPRP